MPSPFPGMDPYIEGYEWTSFHADFASKIVDQVAPKIRPRYTIRPVRRFVTETFEDVSIAADDIYPGVVVLGTRRSLEGESHLPTLQSPLEVATVIPERVLQVTVEIRDTRNRALVTAIEMLSPTNKRGEGYEDYLDKRTRLLRSSTNLIELDLLRRGKRVPMQQSLPNTPYFVFLSRVGRRPLLNVWPITLAMPLPTIPMPLLPGDPDVPLDLQAVLDRVYDVLGLDLTLDYTQPPEIPLEGEDARWVEEYLRGREPRTRN